MAETYHPRGELVHGYAPRQHPFYLAWAAMKDRCNNPNCKGYPDYGGRGITYCDRWKHFANFAEDMWPRTAEHLTLERRNNSEGYSPDNCYWADRTAQCINRRTFKNNTTGARGVVKTGERYNARFTHKGERFNLGRFDTVEEAVRAREEFVERFMSGDLTSVEMTDRRARVDSSIGIKGITVTKQGGFIVRVTVAGERKYIGHYSDLDQAKAALEAAQNDI